MTISQLQSLIRLRNKFRNRPGLQFVLDLANHGIGPSEIDANKQIVGGVREWSTPFGSLIEQNGTLSLAA